MVLAALLSSVGSCVIWFHGDKWTKAEDHAKRTVTLVATVRELGQSAEAFFAKNGRLPTVEELNCPSAQCKPYTFITRQVARDSDGTIRASYESLGVPFSPADPVTIHWDSKTRGTNLDSRLLPWQWKVRFLPWLALGAAIIVAAWAVPIRLLVQSIRRSRIQELRVGGPGET